MCARRAHHKINLPKHSGDFAVYVKKTTSLASGCDLRATVRIDIIRPLAYNVFYIGSIVRCVLLEVKMGYLSIKQTSEKWGITVSRIQLLCTEGRIPGAT